MVSIFTGVPCSAHGLNPYKDEGRNVIYNLLFCDDIKLFKNGSDGEEEPPWSILLSESADKDELKKIGQDPAGETRSRILAYNKLRQLGVEIDRQELLGMIVEYGINGGIDVVAAYTDGTARYINYSGKLITYEAHNKAIDTRITAFMHNGQRMVSKADPQNTRTSPPQQGDVKITLLTSDGVYMREGEFNKLTEDAIGGPV